MGIQLSQYLNIGSQDTALFLQRSSSEMQNHLLSPVHKLCKLLILSDFSYKALTLFQQRNALVKGLLFLDLLSRLNRLLIILFLILCFWDLLSNLPLSLKSFLTTRPPFNSLCYFLFCVYVLYCLGWFLWEMWEMVKSFLQTLYGV